MLAALIRELVTGGLGRHLASDGEYGAAQARNEMSDMSVGAVDHMASLNGASDRIDGESCARLADGSDGGVCLYVAVRWELLP